MRLVKCTREAYSDFIDTLPNWRTTTTVTETMSIMDYWRGKTLVARSIYAKRVPTSCVKVQATYYILEK